MRSKKHHYVPQSLLRQFGINGSDKQVHVFDKLSGRTWPSAVKDAGCENDFNVLRTGNAKHTFEDHFRKCDDALGILLYTLRRTPHLKALTPAQLASVPHIVATQMTRTTLARNSIRAFSNQIKQVLREAGAPPEHIASVPSPSDDDIRRTIMEVVNDLDRLETSLGRKNGLLIEAPKQDLLLSDNPVVLNNSFPYGELGVDSVGIEIYLPLFPGLALGMYCPSILRKIPSLLSSTAPDEVKLKYYELAKALIGGHPTCVDEGMPTLLNELQVVCSSRFLYSATGDFSLATRLLDLHPDLASVESLLTMGKMGQVYPTKPSMPPGTWAVFEGSLNHLMVPITSWDGASEPIQLVTPSMNVRTELEACGDLAQFLLFHDGQAERGIRDVRVDVTESDSGVTLSVLHRDESLNELMKSIGKHPYRVDK